MNADPTNLDRLDGKDSKKPYTRPQLLDYGSIQEMTQNVGMNARPDGGKGNDRTG